MSCSSHSTDFKYDWYFYFPSLFPKVVHIGYRSFLFSGMKELININCRHLYVEKVIKDGQNIGRHAIMVSRHYRGLASLSCSEDLLGSPSCC